MRRLIGAAAAVGGLLVTVLVGAAPASAYDLNGRLQVHGPGTVFSNGEGHYFSQAVTPGSYATYTVKIVNPSPDGWSQYVLRVNQLADAYYSVTPPEAANAWEPDGYYTKVIRPNSASFEQIVLRVAPFLDAPQQSYTTSVALYSLAGDLLDSAFLRTEVKAPAAGTSPYDIFANANGQPAVGGSVGGQMSTAASLKVGQTATFTVKLKNDSPAPTAIGFGLYDFLTCNSYFKTVVKDGARDVTAAATSDTYVSPVLNAGASRKLTVTVKYLVAATGTACDWNSFSAFSIQPGGGGQVDTFLMVYTAA